MNRFVAIRSLNLSLAVAAVAASLAVAQSPDKTGRVVRPGPDGKLVYAEQEDGDRIPDFSNCGYGGGGVELPIVAAKVTLQPDRGGTDDTQRIQDAIDQVSKMPVDADGFRGAVLLKKGIYRIPGSLKINASGVVLRGEGRDEKNGTLVLATGKAKRALITVSGTSGSTESKTGTAREVANPRPITDQRVPVGGRQVTVDDASGFAVGDTVIVARQGNQKWINAIGMDKIPYRKGTDGNDQTKQWGPFTIQFDRVITAIDGQRLTFDAPLACAIEAQWGGGTVGKYDNSGRIERVGIEGMRVVSDFDPSITKKQKELTYYADEDHAGRIVSFDNVQHAWARDLTSLHMTGGVAYLQRGAKWVTVQDCTSLKPVSILTGGRRYPFNIDGQLCLVQRCESEGARHAFAFGSRVPGPNVFLDCRSWDDHGSSEPHHRWSVGGLYDNVNANVSIMDRGNMGSGHGWAGANYVVWNGQGNLVAQVPPTANTWVVGFVGKFKDGRTKHPNAEIESMGKAAEPRSLYLKQLEDRLGKEAVKNIGPASAR